MTALPTAATLIPLLTRDVVAALSDRPAETEAQRETRAREVLLRITLHDPADGMDVMLAAQAVLFEVLAGDAARAAGKAASDAAAARHRQQALALGRMQMAFERQLRRNRPAARPRPVAADAVQSVPVKQAASPEPRREAASAPAAAPAAPRVSGQPPAPFRRDAVAALARHVTPSPAAPNTAGQRSGVAPGILKPSLTDAVFQPRPPQTMTAIRAPAAI